MNRRKYEIEEVESGRETKERVENRVPYSF
jgi:hypothetical protein